MEIPNFFIQGELLTPRSFVHNYEQQCSLFPGCWLLTEVCSTTYHLYHREPALVQPRLNPNTSSPGNFTDGTFVGKRGKNQVLTLCVAGPVPLSLQKWFLLDCHILFFFPNVCSGNSFLVIAVWDKINTLYPLWAAVSLECRSLLEREKGERQGFGSDNK